MNPLATVADVETHWRPLVGAEIARAEALIVVASARVRHRFATVDARITAGSLDPALAAYVVATMVKRAMASRSGDEAIQESIGEAARTWAASDASADAVLLDDGLAGLLVPPGSTAGRPGSARLGLGLPPP